MKNEDNIPEEQIEELLNEILLLLFDKYSEATLNKAANFSLREFVPILKQKMLHFKKNQLKNKRKNNKNKINFTYSSYNNSQSDEISQSFIERVLDQDNENIRKIKLICSEPSNLLDEKNENISGFYPRISKSKKRKMRIFLKVFIIILLFVLIILLVLYLLDVY